MDMVQRRPKRRKRFRGTHEDDLETSPTAIGAAILLADLAPGTAGRAVWLDGRHEPIVSTRVRPGARAAVARHLAAVHRPEVDDGFDMLACRLDVCPAAEVWLASPDRGSPEDAAVG